MGEWLSMNESAGLFFIASGNNLPVQIIFYGQQPAGLHMLCVPVNKYGRQCCCKNKRTGMIHQVIA
jgi:hypothetical protein